MRIRMVLLTIAFAMTACEMQPEEDVEIVTSELTASNGFTFPTGTVSSWGDGNFAACGAGNYFTGLCHTGNDVAAAYGSAVYSLAAGTVIAQSATQDTEKGCPSGWGYDFGASNTCNMALAIQYYDDDGTPFVVVLGHLRYTTQFAIGTTSAISPWVAKVAPGQMLSTVAHYSSVTGGYLGGDHLHWGVYPGTDPPTTHWGRYACPGASQPWGSTTFPSSCGTIYPVPARPGTFMNAASRFWVTPPAAPTLVTPANGSCPVTNTVTFNWMNGSGTYRSMLMICRDASLTSGCINPDGGAFGIEPTGVGQNRSTSYMATLSSGTWYWAVRGIAYNDFGGWGPYSAVRVLTAP